MIWEYMIWIQILCISVNWILRKWRRYLYSGTIKLGELEQEIGVNKMGKFIKKIGDEFIRWRRY